MTMFLILAVSAAIVSTTCVVAAFYLAWHQRKGWGWFLLVGFLVAASMQTTIKMPMKAHEVPAPSAAMVK